MIVLGLLSHELKLYLGFHAQTLDIGPDLAIVQGVIGLAKAFGRKVIAEGVETAALGELLLPMGCELAQGYGIARPMPAADVPAWVANWRPDVRWAAAPEHPEVRPIKTHEHVHGAINVQLDQ